MKLKSEKGFAITDIAISIVVLFIFISLIAILSYNINSYFRETEIRTQAAEIAVREIEDVKTKTIDEVQSIDEPQEISDAEGFFKSVTVEDYSSLKDSIVEPNYVKKVTVTIQYKFKKNTESIKLSTIITKET